MKSWETLSSEIINKNPWSSFHKNRFRLPNGKEGEYFYMDTHAGSAVIVPVLDDGRIVLHRSYRYLFDRISLEFPSGGIKEGQSAEDGARAELKEEVGYTVEEMTFVHKVAPANGVFKEYAHVFVATGLTPGENNPDETEEFQVVLMTPEEIDAAIQSTEIWDGFTIFSWHLTRARVMAYLVQS